jgi:hypothetical protein
LERYSRQVIAIRQARACERKDILWISLDD